ncbi:MAG: NAD(P)/FAD-dependent oxidoreductase [Anditalea sp.]
MSEKYDAIIIGSGPNGLSAAIRLQQLGLRTAVYEQSSTPGGAVRTEELTLKGFKHDLASAIHPLGLASPFFQTLPLDRFNLEWIDPGISFAHPFPDESAHVAYRSVEETAAQFGQDTKNYISLMGNLVKDWDKIGTDLLKPLSIPSHPITFASFGLKALLSAKQLANLYFKEEKTKTFFYGSAAHSTLPLTNLASSSFGLVLLAIAHKYGWPFPKGGASALSGALIAYYQSLQGQVHLNFLVKHLNDLPQSKVYIFDLTPKQLLNIGGTEFSWLYRKRMNAYRYGAGVFKIDWALHEPIPFINEKCRQAATLHIGYSTKEIELSEQNNFNNKLSTHPYVLLAQQSIFDDQRAPKGKHTAWAYCHVPNGSLEDMTKVIEDQIEKVAPGFRDTILARATHNTAELEAFNPNLIGGDINGGIQDITQLFTRPITKLSPYSTPDPRVYICSASTPPGGGVHGMGGYNAAEKVIEDHFKIESEH